MNSKSQLSPSTILFAAKFKASLQSMDLSIEEFLQNFRTINNNQISRL
jgi:hypothetical protein